MIVVGGQAPKAIRSVECYDFEEERWDQVAELPSRRCRAGNKNFTYNLCFLSADFQSWIDVVGHPFSLPLCPCSVFSPFLPSLSLYTSTLLIQVAALLSRGVAPACLPSMATLPPSPPFSSGCSSVSVSPPPPPIPLAWQPTGIQISTLVS